MNYLAGIILFIWLATGLYFGIGGLTKLSSDEATENIQKNKVELSAKSLQNVTIDGITARNQYEYNLLYEQRSLELFFEWAIILPRYTALAITAMSFGLLGTIIFILKAIVLSNVKLEDTHFITMPFLGLLTGVVVLGISYILPTLIAKDANEIRPFTLMFLSLFSGICINQFYEKIDILFKNMFSRK